MNRVRKFILIWIILITSLPAICQAQRIFYSSQDTSYKLDKYQKFSNRQMIPYFNRAGITFPSTQLALLIFKSSKKMELWAKDQQHVNWVYIRTFPILAASGKTGPKLKEGDRQVPEGIYRITELNPHSRYDLSMRLNYPNSFDHQQAAHDGRKSLGGDIFIHGRRSSIGCVAIGDQSIEQLFPLVRLVGVNNTKVIIAPNDLRKGPPMVSYNAPSWVPVLYDQVKEALQDFPAKPTILSSLWK